MDWLRILAFCVVMACWCLPLITTFGGRGIGLIIGTGIAVSVTAVFFTIPSKEERAIIDQNAILGRTQRCEQDTQMLGGEFKLLHTRDCYLIKGDTVQLLWSR